MDDFLVTALEQMLQAAGFRYHGIRDSCEESLAILREESKSRIQTETRGETPKETPREPGKEDEEKEENGAGKTSVVSTWNNEAGRADRHMLAFVLACESRNVKLTHTAIYWLQKLIAYGCLQGSGRSGEKLNAKHPDVRVIDTVLQAVCNCYDLPDDDVQLQIIKVLVTAVGCASCEVHEATLLNSVRACYRIHLIARNPVNRTTAKANLTQMLSSIFQKMEQKDEELEKEKEKQEAQMLVDAENKGE